MADLERAARILEELTAPPEGAIPATDACKLLEALGCLYEEEGVVRVYAHEKRTHLTFSVDLRYHSLPVSRWKRLKSLAEEIIRRGDE